MLTHYLGPRARYMRPVARGGYYNKGEGIRMALAVGAAPCGDFGSFHAEPLDPRSGATEPSVLVLITASWSTRRRALHRRSAGNGGCDLRNHHANHLRAAGRHRLVRSRFTHRRRAELEALGAFATSRRSRPPPRRSWPASSASMRAKLAHGQAYNAACPAGQVQAARHRWPGDEARLHAGKSNWARRIEKAPFFAYPIICGNCFTFGGMKVDSRRAGINADGDPIPGFTPPVR